MGVRHGFDGVVVGVQGAVEQQLTVAGGSAAGDVKRHACGGVFVAQVDERATGHLKWVAFVVGVEAVDELAVAGHERKLGGGAARVDAEPHAQPPVVCVGACGGAFGAVRLCGKLGALDEGGVLGFGGEEGLAGGVVVVGAGEADKLLGGRGGLYGCGRVGEHAG